MKPSRYVHDAATHNRRAASAVVPWLMERYAPTTVLDIRCGTGTWAAVFAEHGCDVRGLDGEQVSGHLLQIPRERFEVVDLETDDEIRRRFWEDESVEWWYYQNMLVATRNDAPAEPLRHVVHPGLLKKKTRLIDDFYGGRVPLRTGALVCARSLLHALRRG